MGWATHALDIAVLAASCVFGPHLYTIRIDWNRLEIALTANKAGYDHAVRRVPF